MTRQLLFGEPLDGILDSLYEKQAAQMEEMIPYFTKRTAEGTLDSNRFDDQTNQFLSDKLVALDRDNAEFCYQICRALKARRIVEAGTSFGVSTLFLAAAVRDEVRAHGGEGIVIATESEPQKAKAARANFAAAGLADFIELREGDLRETLKNVPGAVDFMLIDIWTPMSRPALSLVAPHLRDGAVVVCDNTTQFRAAYADTSRSLPTRKIVSRR